MEKESEEQATMIDAQQPPQHHDRYHYHYRGFWVKLLGFKAHLLNRLPECP